MSPFRLHRPATLEAAIACHRAADDARYLAGGQSLLGALKLGLAAPTDLIDLSRIGSLSAIESDAHGVHIGALATHAAVARSALVRATIPALALLAGQIGDPAVRTRGTLGGSLAHGDPAACYPAAALALGARIVTDRRTIAADEFFIGLYQTALAADEIVIGVHFPRPRRAGWAKFVQSASRFSLVGVFYADTVAGPRVAVTGAATHAFRVPALEQVLAQPGAQGAACRAVRIDAAGLAADLHASAEYRAHLISVLAARAHAQAQA
jgi:carbon-monoxide dehydrogenase medium subunit